MDFTLKKLHSFDHPDLKLQQTKGLLRLANCLNGSFCLGCFSSRSKSKMAVVTMSEIIRQIKLTRYIAALLGFYLISVCLGRERDMKVPPYFHIPLGIAEARKMLFFVFYTLC